MGISRGQTAKGISSHREERSGDSEERQTGRGLSGVYIRKRNQVVRWFSLGGAPQSQENAGAFTVRTPPKLSTPPSSIRSDGRTPSGGSE